MEGMERKQVKSSFHNVDFHKNHKSFNMLLYKSQRFTKLMEQSIHICKNLCLILPRAEENFK